MNDELTAPGNRRKRKRRLIQLWEYQRPVFRDDTTGLLVLHWSRQIGKSHVLACWAVNRLIKRPGRLVVVLSNSRENGAEFVVKAARFAEVLGYACESSDESPDVTYENMRFEVRVKAKGLTGRIKVLAANPRTARGFSGDLILDEFAFHEDANAIWEAVEPMLASNPDFLCRIASTGNGKHNVFYRLASAGRVAIATGQMGLGDEGPAEPCDPEALDLAWPYTTLAGHHICRVPRSIAHRLGTKIYDPNTRKEITPDEARKKALDKRAYDQNYECAFSDENMTLLTHELISAAECEGVGVICELDWSGGALDLMRRATGDIYVGVDVGRTRDLTVITVVERVGDLRLVRGILRIQGMRLPQQQERLAEVCRMPKFRRACLDMTGLGIGLVEYAQEQFGAARIVGINFAGTAPLTARISAEGRRQETVRVTEAMAVELLGVYESRRIQHPADAELRDDLRKPEKITTPGGRVSIAAVRTEAGHADHFWSFALAEEAGGTGGGPLSYEPVHRRRNGPALMGFRGRGRLI